MQATFSLSSAFMPRDCEVDSRHIPLCDADGARPVAARLAEGGLRVVGVVAGLARHGLHLLKSDRMGRDMKF